MTRQQLGRLDNSSRLSSLMDGTIYELHDLRFRPPRLLTSLAQSDSLVLKVPSSDLLETYQRFVLRGEIPAPGTDPGARRAEDQEKDVDGLRARFPELGVNIAGKAESAHLLMIHKLQYLRLCKSDLIRIPESRFVFVERRWLLFKTYIVPAIVQERITGVSLLEMVNSDSTGIRQEYVEFLPRINPRLRALLASDLCNHLNWFIANFLYDATTDVLWYVDSKPSCLFGKRGNDQNIDGLQSVFFAYC